MTFLSVSLVRPWTFQKDIERGRSKRRVSTILFCSCFIFALWPEVSKKISFFPDSLNGSSFFWNDVVVGFRRSDLPHPAAFSAILSFVNAEYEATKKISVWKKAKQKQNKSEEEFGGCPSFLTDDDGSVPIDILQEIERFHDIGELAYPFSPRVETILHELEHGFLRELKILDFSSLKSNDGKTISASQRYDAGLVERNNAKTITSEILQEEGLRCALSAKYIPKFMLWFGLLILKKAKEGKTGECA